MLILQFVFLLSCALSAYAQPQSLQSRLSYVATCKYDNMYDSFNSTGMNDKINGSSSTSYTLFAICDPISGTPIPLTVDQLDYHLALGIYAYEDLPNDGLLDTDFTGNQIRITYYNDQPFANGEVRLGNASLTDYYPPKDVINGVFYRVDKNINTDLPGPLTPPIQKKILEAITNDDYPTVSIVSAMLKINPYLPPSTTSWTFFIPVDTAFDEIPKYQKDLIIGGTGADLFNNHVVNGSHFAAPLKKISSEKSGLEQFTYDWYLTVSGKNVTMRYNYQAADGSRFEFEGKPLSVVDKHYSDGVIHITQSFLFFDELSKTLAPPTLPELFEQYDTFPSTLKSFLGLDINAQKNTQVGQFIALVKQSLAVIPNEDITMFFIWDDTISRQSITSIDSNLVLYLVIKGQFNAETLPKDELIPTYADSSDSKIRINLYDDVYYINGVATLKNTNIKFTKATVHIIDTPFLLAPPCSPTDTLCEPQLNWINETIEESIKKNPEYSTFVGFLSKITFTPSNPYTLIVVKNPSWIYTQEGRDLVKYLNESADAREDFMRRFYIQGGTWFPNAALLGDKTITAEDTNSTTYTLSSLSKYDSASIDSFIATPHVRNDGIYYEIEVTDLNQFNTYYVPPPPVAPAPVPTAPIPTPIKPCTKDCSALRLNGIQIWFSLFFVLAVLFLM